MAFSKTFPKTTPGSSYPVWEEIILTEEEEKDVEEKCQRENFRLLNTCLEQARALAIKQGINTDENRVQLAITLFEKQASHLVFWKENEAKKKFDQKFKY